MLFSSFTFIFGFLPVVLVGFHAMGRIGTTAHTVRFLALASIVFYGWWNWRLIGLLLGSIMANYLFGLALAKHPSRAVLGLGIAFNLSLLGWFKYAKFLAETAAFAFGTGFDIGTIILPLAISFFTFQQIAYLVDIHQGMAEQSTFAEYVFFVSFFPQLIAGPIVHHSEIFPQLRGRVSLKPNVENLAVGIMLFVIGLTKKVVLADGIAPYPDMVFKAAAAGDPISFLPAWAGSAAFGLQIYFDFSGYTDMALGLARIFGVRLPLNFASPYKAASIIEFWRRWHMTLSRFLRDYLYFPLGGNRKGETRRYVNLMIVMLLGGLWHGAAWTFVLWGALHGVYLVVNHLWRAVRGVNPMSRPSAARHLAGMALTLTATTFAWAIFRAQDADSLVIMLKGLFGLSGIYLPASYAEKFGSLSEVLRLLGVEFAVSADAAVYPTLWQFIVGAVLYILVLVLPNTQEWMEQVRRPALGSDRVAATAPWDRLQWRPSAIGGVAAAVLAAYALAVLLQHENRDFIYFQF